MALVRPSPHELNSPSTNEISTDNAEQLILLENPENELRQLDLFQKPEKERLHQLLAPPHELNPTFANKISTDNVEQLDLLQKPEQERLHQLTPHDLNPPSAGEISTESAEQLVLLEKHENEQLHQTPPPRREKYFISAKIALVLIFTLFYHTFCFIVHYRAVPIGRSGILPMGPPFLHFNIVAVITTAAILIVYVALWPVKGVIDEIRAEEFFRLMHTHPNGLPLDSVDAVSATTTGAFDIFMATIHRHCSPLLTSTLVISLVITATSSIAPAALSARSIGVNVDNSTFSIGALPKDSFLVDYGTNGYSDSGIPLSLASTMAYVENFLNLTNGYYKVTSSEGDHFEYLVPFPPGYTSTMKAFWTTDVIVLDPSCSWQAATTANIVNLNWDVTLAESNLSVSISNSSLASKSRNVTGEVSVSVCNNKSSEFTIPVDGSVLFVLDQLEPHDASKTTPMNLSSIPTYKLPTGNVLAFLLCSPHVSIQTRQVWATGNGNLTLGKSQGSQGNVDFYQANYLLSYVLLNLATSSGPTSFPGQVGTDLMQRLLFGTNTAFFQGPFSNGGQGSAEGVYTPAPLTDITAMYKQVIQSAMKTYLSGEIATDNVPGGYTEDQMVFTSSLGHVITSAILFVFLTIALVAAQFRRRRVAFTFVNVAAALADSDVLQKCVEMTQFKAGERKVMKLVSSGDGQLNCAYQSIDED